MAHENRAAYRSVVPGAGVFFRCEEVPAPEHRYLAAVAANMSLGGLFVACRHPPRPGTLIGLQLFSPADPRESSAVRARAIVRWRQAWRQPHGMGVQFLDFEGLGHRELRSWLDTITMPLPFQPAVAAAWSPAMVNSPTAEAGGPRRRSAGAGGR
jgi:hypothetical protein